MIMIIAEECEYQLEVIKYVIWCNTSCISSTCYINYIQIYGIISLTNNCPIKKKEQNNSKIQKSVYFVYLFYDQHNNKQNSCNRIRIYTYCS